MVEIGSVIEAVVTCVEPFGVFLRYGPEEVLVLLPEFSWKPAKDLKQRVQVGDRLKVYVLRYNYQKRQIVGSVRRLHPEENPYRELARLPPGEVLPGIVTLDAGGDLTVRLPNGAWGHLPKNCLTREWGVGETIAVEIGSLNVDEGRLTLAPAHRDGYAAQGAASAASGETTP